MRAILKNHRQSPRKVRLVANFIRGKSVNRALALLNLLPKRASRPVVKLLESAIANAKNSFGASADNLVIKEIRVNPGFVFKRFVPRAFGRAAPVRKRTSHITVVLGEPQKGQTPKSQSSPPKAEKIK